MTNLPSSMTNVWILSQRQTPLTQQRWMFRYFLSDSSQVFPFGSCTVSWGYTSEGQMMVGACSMLFSAETIQLIFRWTGFGSRVLNHRVLCLWVELTCLHHLHSLSLVSSPPSFFTFLAFSHKLMTHVCRITLCVAHLPNVKQFKEKKHVWGLRFWNTFFMDMYLARDVYLFIKHPCSNGCFPTEPHSPAVWAWELTHILTGSSADTHTARQEALPDSGPLVHSEISTRNHTESRWIHMTLNEIKLILTGNEKGPRSCGSWV